MKYRLIAGTINRYEPEEGWENIHLDASPRPIWHPGLGMAVNPEMVEDLADLSVFKNKLFDAVRLSHVLEHLTGNDGVKAIYEVYRVTKPGGTLDIEVPDLDQLCSSWLAGDRPRADLLQWFYSEDFPMPDAHLNAHRYGYNEETLRELVAEAGYVNIEREDAGLAVRLLAQRPEA